jgi:phosphoribosylformylglycinamidine synthase
VEDTGGLIDLDKLLWVTLPFRQKKSLVTSLKKEWDWLLVRKTLTPYKNCRQRARPMYQVGDVTGDHRFTFESKLRVLNQWILLWKTFEVLKSGHDRYLLIENMI